MCLSCSPRDSKGDAFDAALKEIDRESGTAPLSSEGRKIARLCATQVAKAPSSEWYDCIHRICLGNLAKSDPLVDATKAFKAGDTRVFAAMGWEDMFWDTPGIHLCANLKPSSSKGWLEETYPVGGGDGPLSRKCSEGVGSYMSKYNQRILSLTPIAERKSFCESGR